MVQCQIIGMRGRAPRAISGSGFAFTYTIDKDGQLSASPISWSPRREIAYKGRFRSKTSKMVGLWRLRTIHIQFERLNFNSQTIRISKRLERPDARGRCHCASAAWTWMALLEDAFAVDSEAASTARNLHTRSSLSHGATSMHVASSLGQSPPPSSPCRRRMMSETIRDGMYTAGFKAIIPSPVLDAAGAGCIMTNAVRTGSWVPNTHESR